MIKAGSQTNNLLIVSSVLWQSYRTANCNFAMLSEIFTMLGYASVVHVMALCLSVCLSICHKPANLFVTKADSMMA